MHCNVFPAVLKKDKVKRQGGHHPQFVICIEYLTLHLDSQLSLLGFTS